MKKILSNISTILLFIIFFIPTLLAMAFNHKFRGRILGMQPEKVHYLENCEVVLKSGNNTRRLK